MRIALGELHLSLNDFERMRVADISAMYDTHVAERKADIQREWEIMRLQTCLILQPWVKGRLEPRDILQLPWDGERQDRHVDKEAMKSRREYYYEHGRWPDE